MPLGFRIRPRRIVAPVIVLFLVLALVVFFLMPPLVVHGKDFKAPSNRVKAENDVRTTGVQLLGGIALGLGAVFAGITLVYNREQQITERFTRAVEQLGHDSLDVRVGAIYALERIMVDSARDHGPIVEALAAFVRGHARGGRAGSGISDLPDTDRLPGDVQAALTVLGRRPDRLDLEVDHLRLSQTDIRRAHLRNARLQCARLRYAHLEKAHLESADLGGARLRRAFLKRADLEGANLRYADLRGARLKRARLREAVLDHATLVGAHMKHAKLDGASLVHAHLAGVEGDPQLSKKQQAEAHCLPDQDSCDDAESKAELPDRHPCTRYPWD
jgi:Pentapeptide repeats (8 copies)